MQKQGRPLHDGELQWRVTVASYSEATGYGMFGIAILVLTTLLYAGYNLLVKQSAVHAETLQTSTITATIVLQLTALMVSLLFLIIIYCRNADLPLLLPAPAYWWAMAAGMCIGAAEISYFYLFAGVAGSPSMPVSIATPVIVSGTIVLALIAAGFWFGEKLSWQQILGAGLIISGILLLFQRSA